MKRIIVKSICLLLVLLLGMGVLCACDKEEKAEPRKLGEFYTLQEAYEQGFISRDDLERIDYYNDFEKPDSNKYTPELDKHTADKIKETMAYEVRHRENEPKPATANDIEIYSYYGTYNDAVVCIVRYEGDSAWFGEPTEIEIAGLTFYDNYSYPIKVWKV